MFKSKTVADHIYEMLKEEILDLSIQPGQKLSEKSIAARFDVSCAPAKNAIHKLQRDNLVRVIPQVGTIVAPISVQKASDILAIRLLLEPYVAEIAVNKIPEEETDKLKKLHAQLKEAETKKKSSDTHTIVNTFDKELHSLLIRWSGNREIEYILGGFENELRRIRQSTTDAVDSIAANRVQLEAIYSAIIRRSGKDAAAAMREHILSVRDSVLRSLLKKDA